MERRGAPLSCTGRRRKAVLRCARTIKAGVGTLSLLFLEHIGAQSEDDHVMTYSQIGRLPLTKHLRSL